MEVVRNNDYDRYLCAITAKKDNRSDIFALLALNSELAKVKIMTTEKMAALLRLHWWRQALAGLYEVVPQLQAHPLIVDLAEIIPRKSLPKEQFDALLDGYEANIYSDIISSVEEAQRNALKIIAPLNQLVMRVCDIDDNFVEKNIRQASLAYLLIKLLRQSSKDITNGEIGYIAYRDDDHQTIYQPGLESIGQGISIIHSLSDYIEKLIIETRAEKEDLPQAMLPMLLQITIAEVFLTRIKKIDFNIWDKNIENNRLILLYKVWCNAMRGKF